MYVAYHEVIVANKADLGCAETRDVVGPIYESGDIVVIVYCQQLNRAM